MITHAGDKPKCPSCNDSETQRVRRTDDKRRCLNCGELFTSPCTCPDDTEGFCDVHGYWSAITKSAKRFPRTSIEDVVIEQETR